MAQIIVNDEKLSFTEVERTVADTAFQSGMVTVQVKEGFVDKADDSTMQVKNCDLVNFLWFIGSGWARRDGVIN